MIGGYSQLAAELYDLDKPLGHSFGDVEFYRERLRGCRGSILELAVGSGRVLIPLLQAGLKVDGVDSSAAMLFACRQRCQEQGLSPRLYEGNMQDFSLPEKYDAIIVPAGSFLLLENRQAAHAALEHCYQHLNPQGRLIIDLLFPTDLEVGKTNIKEWATPSGEVITLEETMASVDFLTQRTVSYLKYAKWRNAQLVQSELQRFSVSWYGLEEFSLLLSRFGFSPVAVSADYRYGEPPKRAGQTITFEATATTIHNKV